MVCKYKTILWSTIKLFIVYIIELTSQVQIVIKASEMWRDLDPEEKAVSDKICFQWSF